MFLATAHRLVWDIYISLVSCSFGYLQASRASRARTVSSIPIQRGSIERKNEDCLHSADYPRYYVYANHVLGTDVCGLWSGRWKCWVTLCDMSLSMETGSGSLSWPPAKYGRSGPPDRSDFVTRGSSGGDSDAILARIDRPFPISRAWRERERETRIKGFDMGE